MNPARLLRAWLNTAAANHHLTTENAQLRAQVRQLDAACTRATTDLIRAVADLHNAEADLRELALPGQLTDLDATTGVPPEWAEGQR